MGGEHLEWVDHFLSLDVCDESPTKMLSLLSTIVIPWETEAPLFLDRVWLLMRSLFRLPKINKRQFWYRGKQKPLYLWKESGYLWEGCLGYQKAARESVSARSRHQPDCFCTNSNTTFRWTPAPNKGLKRGKAYIRFGTHTCEDDDWTHNIRSGVWKHRAVGPTRQIHATNLNT